MKMTNEEYKRYAEKRAPRSQTGGNMLRAFLWGGAICCLGEFFIDFYGTLGLDAEAAGTACSITLIFLGAALTAAGVYDDLARRAGAGTLVPITGFANSVAAPALEFKTEGFITGTAAKMFFIAGPVIVYGASASVIYGLILLLFRAV
ncbi:MAG: stage V sporulation protein AC [Oscillospiraceae bacterium]|nr:stage V sporulation protein AC [Oscillospiraceae bacterium]